MLKAFNFLFKNTEFESVIPDPSSLLHRAQQLATYLENVHLQERQKIIEIINFIISTKRPILLNKDNIT